MKLDHKKKAKEIFITLIFLFLSNISMILLAWWTGSERLVINLDYFLPILFLAYQKRILFIISFIIVVFFDFLSIFSQVFPFIRLEDFFYLLKFSFISSNVYKLYGLFIVVFLFIQILIFLKTYHKDYNYNILVLFNFLVFIYIYHIYFGGDVGGKFWKPSDNQLVASQGVNYFDYRNRGFIQTYNENGEVFQNIISYGASGEVFKKINERKKVLLIINESWGVPYNDEIQKNIISPLLSNNIMNLKRSSFSFEGFTIGGELRELCQKAPIHFNLKNQINGFENCLPNQFLQAGYHTVAVHGALGLMYDRKYWYPRAGFQELLFRDQGMNLPNSICYSFPGNCDRDIAAKVTEKFQQNEKLFLYWLTLNTHAVYDKRDLVFDSFSCIKYNISQESASCRNLKLQAQFFVNIAKMLNQPEFHGAKVIIVGDHEPPIIEQEKSVFHEKKVPAIEFYVK